MHHHQPSLEEPLETPALETSLPKAPLLIVSFDAYLAVLASEEGRVTSLVSQTTSRAAWGVNLPAEAKRKTRILGMHF